MTKEATVRITGMDIGMRIDDLEVIRGESLTCEPGTLTALVGPSGCGKTTLLHCFGLLQRPSSGHVLVDGEDTRGWDNRRVRRFWRDGAAFVIQDYGIVDDDTVAYNVTMTSRLFSSRVGGDLGRCEEALRLTGLQGRGPERASHLSGGEKQRLAIARAIYKDAAVILADEPTASLDARNRERVVDLLVQRARAGCTVIAATHDDELMAACTQRHAVGAKQAVVAEAEVTR